MTVGDELLIDLAATRPAAAHQRVEVAEWAEHVAGGVARRLVRMSVRGYVHPAHGTRAQLCVHHLRAVFRERKLSYTKRDPGDAIKEPYLEALKARASPPPQGPGHLASFARLLELPRRYVPPKP